MMSMVGVLQISFKFGITMVTAPDSIKFIKSPEDCIVHLNQLNQEFSSSREIEGVDQDTYHMMVTKASGAISVSLMVYYVLLKERPGLLYLLEFNLIRQFHTQHELNMQCCAFICNRPCKTQPISEVYQVNILPL